MENYKKLFNNSIIFAIGNLGSKLISFVLLPLYTYYLSPKEFGTVDIVVTTTSMVLPVISLSIYEAVLRFIMENENDKEKVFSNAFFITLIGNLFLFIACFFVSFFFTSNQLLIYSFFIIFFQSFQSLFAQYARAVGKNIIYSINGLIMAFVISVSAIIFLIPLRLGIQGYLLSIVLGNMVSIFYFSININISSLIRIRFLDNYILKRMLIYSIPMIPNTFMWWLTSSSSRYFLLYYEGASANGIFSVANKIPSLISIISTIFFQAWQLSAIEEYRSFNKSEFYTNVFKYFSSFMFLITALLMVLLKPLMNIFSSEYFDAWKFIPFLLLGVIFSGFSSFISTNYMAAKQTNGIFKTSILGGILNLILNFIFIKVFGALGAAIATMVCFFVIWVLRHYDTQKYITIILDYKILISNISIILIQTIVLFTVDDIIIQNVLMVFLLIFSFIINKELTIIVFKFLNIILKKILRR